MDYTEFKKTLDRHFFNVLGSFFPDYYYHVIIHRSAFDTFCSFQTSTTLVFHISPLWEEDHLHLIFQSELPFMMTLSNIRFIPILSSATLNYVKTNFVVCDSERHSVYCNVSFGMVPIQTMSINTLLRNLNYLHDMFQLSLPKKLFKKIFKQSQRYNYLPRFVDGETYSVDYNSFLEIDHVHEKGFVVWFQHTRDLFFKKDYVVTFDFITPENNQVYSLCLKCMKFEKESGHYIRRFALLSKKCERFYFKRYVQDRMHWCRACKQVPLFHFLPRDRENHDYSSKENVMEYMYYPRDNTDAQKKIIRFEHFENGEWVKTDYVNRIRKRKGCSLCGTTFFSIPANALWFPCFHL